MWNFIVKGGPVMLPIILGSIYGLAIILEKFLVLEKNKNGFVQVCPGHL